jgi:hypothetical protein
VNYAELTINRLTMTGFDSYTASYPGALNNLGGHVTITKSRFTENGYRTDRGSAIRNAGQLRVTSTAFTDNAADSYYGGAVANDSGSSVLVSDTFWHNTAHYGGAVYVGVREAPR